MKEAIYHFKSAVHIGGKGYLNFYKTKKFSISRGWNGNVYLEHNGNIIAMLYVEDGTPLLNLRAGTRYEKRVCNTLLRSLGIPNKYIGGDCLLGIYQQYKAIKDGSI